MIWAIAVLDNSLPISDCPNWVAKDDKLEVKSDEDVLGDIGVGDIVVGSVPPVSSASNRSSSVEVYSERSSSGIPEGC